MHAQYEHSPPTSSRSTMAVRSPFCLATSATFSPAGPAPMTITSKSRFMFVPFSSAFRPTAGSGGSFRVILGGRMLDVLLPATDAGVIAQAAAVVVVWAGAQWALRNRPDSRLLTFGAGLVVLAFIGVRALH